MRSRQFKADNKLSDEDYGVEWIIFLSECLEMAVTRDQLDVSNLLVFEKMERKRRWLEEHDRQKYEEVQLSKNQGRGGSMLMAEAFAGAPRMTGGAIIMPALVEFVAKKASEDSEIMKQQRKLLEARGLAAPKKGAK